MGCRANIEIAGKRVWEIFSDARTSVGSIAHDHPVFVGQNRSLLYDLVSESPINANGDLTSKTDASGTTTYEYDALGNLRKVTPPTGSATEYVIDGNNRRVGKKVGGALTTQYVYSSDLRIVAELNGSGAVVSRFVYGTRVNVPEYIVKGGSTYRIVTDHLGSVRKVVDTASGSVAQAIEYDEFGVVLSDSAPGFQPFGFAGGLVDGASGFVRFGARDYSSKEGRWTSKDPIRFEGGDTNLYGYVLTDPVNYFDPNGELFSAAGWGVAIGGAAVGWRTAGVIGAAIGFGIGLALVPHDPPTPGPAAGSPAPAPAVNPPPGPPPPSDGGICKDPWTKPDNDNDPDREKRNCIIKATNAEMMCLSQGRTPIFCSNVWLQVLENCLAGIGS